MAIFIPNRKHKETGNNSSVSEIETTEIIEPAVTVPPGITHEEISNGIGDPVINEINEIAETVPPPPFQPNTPEPAVYENEIESGPEPPATEFNSVDPSEIDTERPPAPISQRKNRRRKKKPHVEEDNNIDEEFASRLDDSCNDDQNVKAPTLENSVIAGYA